MSGSYVWSWTGLSAYRQCPLQFAETKVRKRVAQPSSPALVRGREVHDHIAQWLSSGAVDPIDPKIVRAAPRVQSLVQRLTERYGPVHAVEHMLGVRRDWSPCDFFADDVWGRNVCDALWAADKRAVVIDWKTGTTEASIEQLQLLSAFVMAHMPRVATVSAAFVYVDDTSEDDRSGIVVTSFTRQRFEWLVQDGVADLDELYRSLERDEWPTKAGKHCSWCPVVECKFNRRRKL